MPMLRRFMTVWAAALIAAARIAAAQTPPELIAYPNLVLYNRQGHHGGRAVHGGGSRRAARRPGPRRWYERSDQAPCRPTDSIRRSAGKDRRAGVHR